MPPTLTRRDILHAAASSLLGANRRLAEAAAEKGIMFGSMVTASDLAASPPYAELVARHCASVTPGIEAKFGNVHPKSDKFDFRGLDSIAAYASSTRKALRMHTLVWGVGIPAWALEGLRSGRGRIILKDHIHTVAARYRGAVYAWDVVNEAADPRWPSDPDGLCLTPWRQGIGADYVDIAFDAAHEADPTALLCLNDDDLEYSGREFDRKRETYIRLIDKLQKRNVPISGFGIEAHLKPWLPRDDVGFTWFLQRLAERGLAILVTELDVFDREFASEPAVRDRACAAVVKTYLDCVLAQSRVLSVSTWGLADPFSSQAREPIARRLDGLPPRPLPFDESLSPKPMYTAILEALAHAPQRT